MKLSNALCLIISFFFSTYSHAQIIGGQGNGQQHPTEVKPSELSAGGFSGNVNLFSGTYNASYPLGTVSTPTGLSFTATLSYGSSFTSGDNLPHTSGIPYGEGWNLDIPSVSVSTEDFNKYTLWEKWQFSSGSNNPNGLGGEYTPTFELNEAFDEGGIYWFAPTLNIPGVASGRMVYKYYRQNLHYFVLHTFDRYIEATFDGGQWEIVVDDGTRYQMIPVVVNYRTPSNQRVPSGAFNGYLSSEGCEGEGGGALEHLVLPKKEVLTWYCSKISNRNIIGNIHFKYETFGGMDFNKVFTQQDALWNNISRIWLNPTGPIARKPDKVYKDIILKEVDSGYERLVLEHQSISVSGGDNMLDFVNDNGVTRLDSMYSYKTVYSASGANGASNGFDDWYRYVHPKRDAPPHTGYSPSATNPYKGYLANSFRYQREEVSNNAFFDHGYLESPRMDRFDIDIVPGETYEIKTDISGCSSNFSRAALLDINIATGNNVPIPQDSPNLLNAEEYERTTRESVYSTFNQAMKWFTHGSNNPQQGMVTSNFFTMPNLPSSYEGFHIQIGPGNSDNDFATSPCDLYENWNSNCGGTVGPLTCNTYFKEVGDNTAPGSGFSTDVPLRSGDNIPNNFGVGAPWWMLHEFYSNCLWQPGYTVCPACIGQDGPNYLDFWWNYTTGSPCSSFDHPNEPTLAGPSLELDKIELIRYSKTPYMLRSAKKQILNSGATVTSNPNDNWHTVGLLEFDYEIEQAVRFGTYIKQITVGGMTSPPELKYEWEGMRNIVLLKTITQQPYNPDGIGNNIPLVTSFGYDELSPEDAGPFAALNVASYSGPSGVQNGTDFSPNLLSHYFTLESIVDPLGKETMIEYDELLSDGSSSSYFLKKFNHRDRPSELLSNPDPADSVRQAPNYAFQVNMVVSSVTVKEREEYLEKCWSYEFPTQPGTYDDQPFMDAHFSYDQQYNLKAGFSHTTVYGPNQGCGGTPPKTVYFHHTNSNNNLFWGKLFKVESYDENGDLVSETSTTYDAVVAFESPAHRESADNVYDYKEYILGAVDDRPILQSVSDIPTYNDDMHDYTAPSGSVPAPTEVSNGHEVDPDDLRPDVPGPFDCDGEPCGCADYPDLEPNEQLECEGYWADYYVWITTIASQGWNTPMREDYSPHLFYESKYDSLIEEYNPYYLYSFFIKKTGETSTVYDNGCSGGSAQMSTTTSFEYFDADLNGIPSQDPGYEALGAQGPYSSSGDPVQLTWEPSWQLYKKTTTSGQYSTTEEYFYLWDLINNPTYQEATGALKPIGSQEHWMLYTLWKYKGARNLLFEKRVTRTAPGDTNKRSTYYTYANDWEQSNAQGTIINLIDPDVDEPCPGNPGSGNTGSAPNLPQCFTHVSMSEWSNPPSGYCEDLHDPPIHIWCQCGINETPANNFTGGSGNGGSLNYTPTGETVNQMVANHLNGKMFLKSVVEQVSPPDQGQDPDLILDHSAGIGQPVFPYDTLSVQTILKRSKLGLVAEERDEKDLVTAYTYGSGYMVEYLDCSYNPPRLRSIFLSNFPGLPTSVTVGKGLQDALTTEYDYNVEDNTIKTIVDPNNMELSYEYDGFGRMAEAHRNGQKIQSVKYSNIRGEIPEPVGGLAPPPVTFKSSASANYVDVFNFVNGSSGWGSKSFVDPLGRKVATVNYASGSEKILVEDNIFDIYGRVEQQLKRKVGSAPTVNEAMNPLNLNFEYDVAPRDRAIKSAKYTLDLDDIDDHFVENAYCILTGGEVKTELTAAGKSQGLDYISDTGKYSRTKTTDEDGKFVVTFTDQGGNTAATITKNGSVATVFRYDAFGNVSDVSNAEEQHMAYQYNYLGWLLNKTTPDEGSHAYAYNQSGQMICNRDGQSDVRVYDYDAFGRMKIQAKSTSGDQGMLSATHDGMPWRPDRSYVFLDNALAGAEKEKQWFYNEYDDGFPIDYELEFEYVSDQSNCLGRLAHTNSYDLNQNLVEMKFFSYNNDGFLSFEAIQFSSDGVGSGKDISTYISYPAYNLQGSYLLQNVDILHEGGKVDYQHKIGYDNWNRIEEVKVAFADLGDEGFKVVRYSYDDVLGVVSGKAYFNSAELPSGDLCKDLTVDQIDYTFDQRERLTDIDSKLYSHSMMYDGTQVNTGHKNWNGNINGTTASYIFDDDYVLNVPDNFHVPTTYGYRYDNLNRLYHADADASIFDPQNPVLYSGDPTLLGTVDYTYDKVGNLQSVERGNVYYNDATSTWDFGNTLFNYTYAQGNNQMIGITLSGLKRPGCTASGFAYAYDGNGNLTTDTKKGLAAVTYGRANLPYGLYVNGTCENPVTGGSVTYLYDASDARIFKFTQENGEEYYLKDAAGHELFVRKDGGDYTWYVYGNERVAKIGDTPPLEEGEACRVKPACDPGVSLLQEQFLQNLAYTTVPSTINFPTKLFRIRLCNGFEPHLLASELDNLPGNYRILQQIELISPNQEFSVWQTSGLTTEDLSTVLSLRIDNDGFLLNGYTACSGIGCPSAVTGCTEGESADISALQAQYANLQGGAVVLPTHLVRVRLCDNREMYVLLEMLPDLPGNYTILQQVQVSDPEQLFEVMVDGDGPFELDLGGLVPFLLQPGRDVRVNGYEPCFNGQPCPEGFPECSYEVQTAQAAAMPSIEAAFINANANNYPYPLTIRRIRLCSGIELYLAGQAELDLVPGNYLLLQQLTVANASEYFSIGISNGPQVQLVTGDMGDFVEARRNGTLYSIDRYEPCGELSPCHPEGPGCSPEEWAAQEESMSALLHAMESLDPAQLSLSHRLFLVRFCDGSTMYVLEQELPLIEGSYAILQDVLLIYLTQPINIVEEDGTPLSVTVSDLLTIRWEQPGIVVDGHGCTYTTETYSADCEYRLYMGNWQPTYDDGPPVVIGVDYDVIVTRNCGDGEELVFQTPDQAVLTYPLPGGGFREIITSTWTTPCGSSIHSTWTIVIDYIGGQWAVNWSLSGEQNFTTATCTEQLTQVYPDCGPPIIVHTDDDDIACDPTVPLPDPDGDGCPPDETVINQDITELETLAGNTNELNISYPNNFRHIKFSDGRERVILDGEDNVIDDCISEEEVVRIDSANQVFFVRLPMGEGNARLGDILALRAEGVVMGVEGPDQLGPNPGDLMPEPEAVVPTFTFFIHDHLGNSRILYTNELIECNPDSTKYLLEHVMDYYPYGKILREYVHNRERFQTTHHERDEETGLDYRGARFYDGDVGRFLSVDPLAADYAAWSTYNYVFGNPISYIDPDGRSGENVNNEYRIIHKEDGTEERQYVSDEGGDEYDIIHHTDEYAVPDARHSEWTQVVVNPHGAAGARRIGPGAWMGPPAQGTVNSTDSPVELALEAPKAALKAASVGLLALVKRGAVKKADDAVNVFRVYGGKAKADGFSWTPVNPNSVSNFRDAAGLPNANTGRFVIEGTVSKSNIIKQRSALPLDGNKGGLSEYIINPKNVTKTRVSGANPEY